MRDTAPRVRSPRASTLAARRRHVSGPAVGPRLTYAERPWQDRMRLLHRIKSLPEAPLSSLLSQALRLVVEFYGFDYGLVSRVQGECYALVASYTRSGEPLLKRPMDTQDTLCAVAMERGDAVAYADLRTTMLADHPVVTSAWVQCFLAAPVPLHDALVGTVAFGRSAPRSAPFGPADEEFIRLVARWVSVRLDHEHAMSELRQSEERFRVLSEATFEAIVMSEGGVVFDANDRAMQLFGFNHGARLIGKAVCDLVHPDDLLHVQQSILRQREETYEARLLRPDGTSFLARIQGRPIPYDGRTVRVTAVHDVTEERAQEKRLQFQADVLSQVHDAVIATDRFQRIVFWNDGAQRLTGIAEADVMGQPLHRALRYEWPSEATEAEARAALLASGQWHGEVFVQTRFGLRCAELTTTRRSGTRFEGLIVVGRDVTERYSTQQELLRQARQDPLTGLCNRAAFVQRLSERHDAFQNGEAPYGLVFIDLDRFKLVNDTHGHAAGDALLREVGLRLQRVVRRGDVVARLGGDEFAALLHEPGGRDGLALAASRIEKALSLPIGYGDVMLHPSASIGTALATPGTFDFEAVLREADVRMYDAKRQRQGPAGPRVAVQPPPSPRAVLPEGHKVLYAQPIVALGSGALAGFEVLVRWQHPTRGLLGPGAFLPTVLATDAMADFDAEIVQDAARWAATLPDVPVYVNLSRRGLLDPATPQRLAAAFAETGVSPARLVVELTEQMHESEHDLAAVERLRGLGVRLCLDDFGAGHTSVTLAESLPLDVLKVDRGLIGRLGPHSPVERMLEGVVGMAHARGLAVVAEGIETPDQLLRARALGFDRAQGFLFSFPIPLDAAADLIGHPLPWECWWTADVLPE